MKTVLFSLVATIGSMSAPAYAEQSALTKEEIAKLEAATATYIQRTEMMKKSLMSKGYDIHNITQQEVNLFNAMKETKNPNWKPS
jgi:hypothetical protein